MLHHPNGDLILKLDGSTASFTALGSTDPFDYMDENDGVWWTVTELTSCGHSTDVYSNATYHSGKLYTLSQVSGDNTYYFQYNSSTSTVDQSTASTSVTCRFDFMKYNKVPDALSLDDNYFGLFYNCSGTSNNLYKWIEIKYDGSTVSLGVRSQAYNFDVNTGVGSSDRWSTTGYSCFFKIYRLKNVSEKLADLKEEYIGKLSTSNKKAKKFGVGANQFTTYIEKINDIKATTEDDLTSAETEMQSIVDESAKAIYTDAEVNQMILNHFNGKYILLKNGRTDGSVRYLNMANQNQSGTGFGGDYVSWSEAITAANVWQISIAHEETDSFVVKLRNPLIGKYCYTESANDDVAASTNSEGLMYFVPASVDGTKFQFKFKKLADDGNDRCYLINNSSEKAKTWTSNTGNCQYAQWYLTFLTDEQAADIYETLKTEVSALTYSDGSTTSFGYDDVALYGDDLNQYKDPLGKLQAQFKTTVASASANDFDTVVDKYNATIDTETYDVALKGSGINMPVAGSYLRIRTAPAWRATNSSTWSDNVPYLSSLANATNAKGYLTAQFVLGKTGDNELQTILYYSGEGLATYATGRCARGDGNSDMLHFNDDSDSEGIANNTSITISFPESAKTELGTYNVKYGTNNRYMYTNAGNYADGGSAATGDNGYGYNFQLEYVESLPVTVGTDGIATLCVPVAVTIPSDTSAEYFVAKVNSDGKTMTLTNAAEGTSYAAKTSIFVKGTAGTTVNFPIAYSGETNSDYVCDELSGNYNKTTFTAQDGYVTYVPTAKPSTASLAPGMRRVEASGTSVYFAKTSDTLDANTPILTLNQATLGSTDAVEAFEVEVKDGETVKLELTVTSVSELTTEQPADNAPVYDLMGRRVLNPQHGLFIMNGKIFRK